MPKKKSFIGKEIKVLEKDFDKDLKFANKEIKIIEEDLEKDIKFARKEARIVKKEIKHIEEEIGPGVITGGSDNDPAGIITYTTAGALFGYALLWVLVLCTPLMIVAQEMAGRLAIVKRQGLSSIIKEHYGKKIAIVVMSALVMVNLATIGADIAGMAAVVGMITGFNFVIFILPITALVGYLVLFKKYKTIRNALLILTFSLVVYVISAFISNPDWLAALQGVVPSYIPTVGFIAAAIGIIGTTISPYMMFWQASDELEEHKKKLKPKELEFDTTVGMLWSNIIAAFIIIAAAATLYGVVDNIDTAEAAAMALRPLAGEFAYLLFSFGIIIAGFLALPVLAGSTAYAVSETFGWKEGINKKFANAKGFYFVFLFALLIGALLAFLPINPIHFLYYTQIADGFLTPFLVGILLLLCNNKQIMREHTNSRTKNIIGVLLIVVLGILDILLIGQFLGIGI